MVFPSAFISYEDYFTSCLKFLDQYKWIFNFPVTEILVNDALSHIPDSWIQVLSSLDDNDLNNFPSSLNQENWPNSLIEFSSQCDRLKLKPCEFESFDASEIPELLKLGITPKKVHEVVHLVPLIHKLCHEENIDKIIDIGSGMGYLDEFLYLKYSYQILGIEFSKKLVESSRLHFEKLKFLLPRDHGGEIKYIINRLTPESITILQNEINSFFQEDNLRPEIIFGKISSSAPENCALQTSRSHLLTGISSCSETSSETSANFENKSTIQAESVDSSKRSKNELCLIGLHTCGDLCSDSLSLFLKVENCKLCLLLACCYHKMTKTCVSSLDSIQNSFTTFKNFPLSLSLKLAVSSAPHVRLFLQIPFLRLAANETFIKWSKMSLSEHENQLFHTMARAVIQLYFHQNDFTMKKTKRRCVTKSSVNDFKSYLLCFLSRCQIWNKYGETVCNTDPILIENMLQLWNEEKHKQNLVKVVLCLQASIQFVAESLIVIDRVKYLLENGIKSVKIIKALDDSISPRALALFAKK